MKKLYKRKNGLLIISLLLGFFFMVFSTFTNGDVIKDPLDPYNVIWSAPSEDSSGSMPIGNGDIGLNVWAEENGDMLFDISKKDTWSVLHKDLLHSIQEIGSGEQELQLTKLF